MLNLQIKFNIYLHHITIYPKNVRTCSISRLGNTLDGVHSPVPRYSKVYILLSYNVVCKC